MQAAADAVAESMKQMFKEVEYTTSVSRQTGDQLFELLGFCGHDEKADKVFM